MLNNSRKLFENLRDVEMKLDDMIKSKNVVDFNKSKEQFIPSDLSVTIEVKGVGYRIRREEVRTNKQKKVNQLVFDVGTSSPLLFELPKWVTASVDNSATKRVLKPIDVNKLASPKEAMGNLTHQILRLRPRSPYTGNGILLAGKVYPALKSTKTSKK